MSNTYDIDAALAALAADAAQSSPRPGADLVARVLADAASIAVAQRKPEQAKPAPATRFSQRDLLFGWTGGATAAAALALVVGISIGMQIEGGLPMMAAEEPAEPAFLSADSGFLPDDML